MVKADKELEKIREDIRALHNKIIKFNYLAGSVKDRRKEYQAQRLSELVRLMSAVARGENIDDD